MPHENSSLHNRRPALQETSCTETLRRRRVVSSVPNEEADIYFNSGKKYNYMKGIIDKYFEDGRKSTECPNALSTIAPRAPSIRRLKKKEAPSLEEEIKCNPSSASGNSSKDSASPEALSKSNELSTSTTNSVNLPPIWEDREDRQTERTEARQSEQLDLLGRIEQTESKYIEQHRRVVFENQIYILEVLGTPRITHRLKTFKVPEMLKREERALELGMQSIWSQYRYNTHALIAPAVPCLRDLLFQVRKTDPEKLQLRTKKYHSFLLAEDCQELIRVVMELCSHLQKVENRVINNKVNCQNIFLIDGNWRLAQWAHAAFRERHCIQERDFQSVKQPILKDSRQWFVTPEYLAPEIIQALIKGEAHIDSSASDVWSLGLTIFEVLTVIPVWMHQKCSIGGQIAPEKTGLLSEVDGEIKKIAKKQQNLRSVASKKIEECVGNSKIAEVVGQMLAFQREDRPSFADIIKFLSL